MDLDQAAVQRARELMASGRAVLGICGSPGAGKSTVARQLARLVGEAAVVVPMDGFHLHDDELGRLGRSERKGAPDTFDVAGYVALLRRIRAEQQHPVYAPLFDREHEQSVAGAIAVRPEHRLVITEGNYLLHDAPPWREVRDLLDEVWFVEVDEALRLARLVERHEAHGRTPEDALHWATVSDQANADLVSGFRDRADLVLRVD